MKKLPVVSLIVLCLFNFMVSNDANAVDHQKFDALLKQYVNTQGEVNYKALKQNGAKALDIYLAELADVKLKELSRPALIALYINAYNAFTLKLIIDHYPITSIRKIPKLSGFFGHGQWKKPIWNLGGKKTSLDIIEHKILRPMGEPRIHFALVCAAKSCPNLSTTAYTEKNLDQLLDEQGKRFNQSVKGAQLVKEGETFTLEISSIYKWFERDFLKQEKSLALFVARYLSSENQATVRRNHGSIRVEFLPYDWSLNDQP